MENEKKIITLKTFLSKKLISAEAKKMINMKAQSYLDGSLYFGQLNQQIRQGVGIYYFPNKEIYGGKWKNNKFEGKGMYIYNNGDVYEGELSTWKRSNKCGYNYANGNKYEGS